MVGCSDSASKENTDLDGFIAELDGKSIDEIKEEINSSVSQFEQFLKFFDSAFANEIEKIKKDDERYEPKFKVDTSGINNALNQFDNVLFTQNFQDGASQLTFTKNDSDVKKPMELGEGVSQLFIPNKIYYHSGVVRTDSVADYELDFTFQENWGQAIPIDSIDIAYNVTYIKDYDVIELSLDKPKVSYKGGEIKLVQAKNNYVYLTFSDTISSPIKIQGLNDKGEVLSSSGYSNNKVAPGEGKTVFKEMLSHLKKVQKKLNDDDFKNTAEFQKYLKKNLGKLDYFNDTDGLFHSQRYYYGTVKSLKLYFSNTSETRDMKFTARNEMSFENDAELFPMETENGLVFLNNKGQSEFEIASFSVVEKITGNFYEDADHYFYLNRTQKRLDTLLVYNIEAFNYGLMGVRPEQDDDNYSLFNSENKLVSDKTYTSLKNVGAALFGLRDDKFYALDDNGNETYLPGINRIYGELSDDRIMASNKDYIGFINSKGKIVIPFKYKDAKDFEDGITAVQFGGTYKLIDVNGKVLVDTEEDYINFFGEDEDGKRIYKFDYGKKVYNYKGELIDED